MRLIFKLLLIAAVIGGCLWLVRASGPYLIINAPVKSDALLVLGGDEDDMRYHRGLELLRTGYAPRMFYDAQDDTRYFGTTDAERAREFVATAPADVRDRIIVCPVAGESTFAEMRGAGTCLRAAGVHTVVIVTSDFHTRRALSVARKRLPEFQWSVAATPTSLSRPRWWSIRYSLKQVLLEYEKLLWWKLVESHR